MYSKQSMQNIHQKITFIIEIQSDMQFDESRNFIGRVVVEYQYKRK